MLSSKNTQTVAAEVVPDTEHIHVDEPMKESKETRNENANSRTMATNGVEVNAEGYQEFNTDLRVNTFNKQFKKCQHRHKIEGGLRTTLSELPQEVLGAIELLADGNSFIQFCKQWYMNTQYMNEINYKQIWKKSTPDINVKCYRRALVYFPL
ncbi:hypothetical protein DPMN_045622 [Dreissena polymorpha]|uniref:Uncharacterized protein n=1 Tax=Dreissena polymorpha TaxID=45954 RepID=A0A9D4D848_DREPO|nr:hypothetical protein DPMN_045622 [Dreissena polymorpha]